MNKFQVRMHETTSNRATTNLQPESNPSQGNSFSKIALTQIYALLFMKGIRIGAFPWNLKSKLASEKFRVMV